MIKNCLFAALCLSFFEATCQPYVEGGNTRHRFAQMYLGTDFRVYPQQNTVYYQQKNGQLLPAPIPAASELRLHIGGLHFWGHADFFVAFRVASINQSTFKSLVETGGKYYPWRIESNKLRPFVGVSFITQTYKQGEATNLGEVLFPLLAGLTYTHKNHLFELTTGYTNQFNQNYFYSQQQSALLHLPSFSLSIGYKFSFDTSLSAEKNWQNGTTQRTTEKLAAAGRLNGFTAAVGFSGAFFSSSSSFNDVNYPYLGQHKLANIYPEFGIGYYFHKPDIHLNLVYRSIKSRLEAFSHTQTATRTAFTLEGYKFLGDYHGFAPFAGLTLSAEYLYVLNEYAGTKQAQNGHFVKPGFIAGWDIRPNRIQTWYLRTNIRWAPILNLSIESANFSFSQLEINFIQLVVFPGRLF